VLSFQRAIKESVKTALVEIIREYGLDIERIQKDTLKI